MQPLAKCDPLQWKVDLGRGHQFGVIPDGVFGLQFAKSQGMENQVWFCVEADRGTMPVRRKDPEKSSVHRKLLAYQSTWSNQIHRRLFSWNRFRVLFVTTNRERMESMREAVSSLRRAPGLFLFSEAAALTEAKSIFDIHWRTCRKPTETLLD